MKKFIFTICLLLLFIPCMVNAKDKDKIKVYIFYGDGCPHCHNAMEFFKSIEEEYGKYFELVSYETWYSSTNNKLMLSAAEALNTDTTNLGVPYIIIGDKTFLGYTESYNEDIKEAIVNAYNDDDYKDKILPLVTEMKSNFKATISLVIGACGVLSIVVIINIVLRKKYLKSN